MYMRKIPLEEALTREEYLQTNFKIPIILGCDDDGKLLVDDLMRMPHILIGGVTGSGKSASASRFLHIDRLPMNLRLQDEANDYPYEK